MSYPTMAEAVVYGIGACLVLNLVFGLMMAAAEAKLSWDRKRFSYKEVQRIVKSCSAPSTPSNSSRSSRDSRS